MKNKAFPKKLFAMFLAATLVCTMLQCTFFTAFAEAATIDELITAVNADGKVTQTEAVSVNTIVDLYNAMDATTQANYTESVTAIKDAFYTAMSTGYTTFTGVSDFSLDYWTQLQYVDGCVRYSLANSGSPGLRVGPRAMMAIDGLEFMFNRLYQTEAANNCGIGIQLTSATSNIASSSTYASDFTAVSTKGILVYFDFKNGKVLYNLKKSSTDIMYRELITDESRLKLENISYKAFTVGFAKGDEENPLNVIIKIADGSEPIILPIPAEYYDKSIISLDGNVNAIFNRGAYTSTNGATSTSGAVYISFDVVGYRNTKAATAAVNAIKPLNVDTITEADAKTIYDAEGVVLTELDKAELGDSAKLSKLKAKLIDIANNGYKFGTISGYHAASVLKNKDTYKTDGYAHFGFAYTSNAGGTSTPGVRANDETAVAVDGLKMKFGGYKDTSANVKSKGIAIKFHKASGDQDLSTTGSGVMLYIDILNGKLIYNLIVSGTKTVETLVTDSDVIKGLHGQIFTLEINATTETGYAYEVEIKTASGDVQKAKIPASDSHASVMFDANGKTYYGFARGAYLTATAGLTQPVGNEFDFFGCANTKNIKAVEALIAALPEVNAVTTNDGNVIFKVEQAYATLTDDEKALVDDTKLTAVRAKYDELFTAETEALEYTVVTDALLTSGQKISDINSWWGKEFATALEGNGIRVKWGNGSKANRLAIGSVVNMDGLTLRFNNLKKTGATKAELTVLLSRNSSNYHEGLGVPYFALVLDTEKGTLKVSTNWSNADTTKQNFYDIIENDLLKYENIAGGKFTIGFEEVGELEYKATVTVGNQSVSGIIPAQALEDVSAGDVSLYNPKHCHFAIAAWSGNAQTVDVVGYKTEGTVQHTQIAGATLTVSDSISVNYKVNADILKANLYVNPEIKFEIAGSTLTVVGEKEEGTGYYNFTYPDIAPHLMNETITATLYAYRASDLESPIRMGDTKEYSIKQYCYNMLEKYKDDEELCDLIVDLLRYGAASQTYADKDAENLVTADLTTEQNSFGTTFVAPADSVASKVALSGTPATKYVSWKAVALYLADVVNLRYRFTLADGVDVDALKVTATVNGVPVTVENPEIESAGTNMYYLYFDAFSAANMRDVIEVTICDAEGNAVSTTATYSVESYVKAQLAKSPEADYEALLKALLCYGDSAKAYKNR